MDNIHGRAVEAGAILMCAATLGACDSNQGFGFQGNIDAGQELFDELVPLGPTGDANMPTTGTATYQGFFVTSYDVSDTETERASGQATFDADFEANEVSGRLYDVVTESDELVTGELSVNNGAIVGDQMFGDVSGDLGLNGETANLDGVINGQFLGDEAQGLLADMSGDITYSGGFTGDFDGEAIAEQQ